MTKVIAALDNSMAAKPVLSTALAFAALLDAEVEPVHISEDGDRIARGVSGAEGLELQTFSGPVVERLTEIAEAGEVVALVLGSRGTPAGRRPLGSTALALATSLSKPVIVVPPEIGPSQALERVLIPIEGALAAAPAELEIVLQPCERSELDIVVLHVHEEHALPAFTDQPQHEHEAWAREFLRRHCPWNIDRLQLETRVGRSEDLVPLMARQAEVDLVALTWAQELGEGHAAVVRAVLARGHTPVMLVPIGAPSDTPRIETNAKGRAR
ncbi:MAG: universal stress protein [Gaiellaceae bacterium]|jgi:nucleotide-binding universal stress UspA family protein